MPIREERLVEILGPAADAGRQEILSEEALRFVGELSAVFEPRRQELLERRRRRARAIRDGQMPNFPPETRAIREAEWRWRPSRPI